jgi:pimeloyl-ACP methyl ester carboxylesterase
MRAGHGALRPMNHGAQFAARRGLIALSMLVGMSLLITGATSAATAAPQGSAPALRAAGTGIAWTGCGERLECARVRVPLDWDRPRGPKIKLSVIRHLASRPDQRIGSLFINPGGPGASLASVRVGGEALDGLVEGRLDIVTWDIRGSGKSAGVSCFKSERRRARFWDRQSIPTTTPSSRRYLPKTAAFARRCGALNGALLAHISTTDTVRDLDYLRRLVGDRKLTFYGASFGTFLAQTYANMFPRRVRAIVLDGVVDPVPWTAGTEPQIANLRGDTDLVFEKFQSLCESAGPANCALAGQGPVARRVSRLLARLKRRRIAAPSATPPGRLAYGEALTAITLALDAPAVWPQLAEELDAAADGDGSSLATRAREELADLYSVGSDQTRAIVCADSPARQAPRAWPRVVDRLTDVSRIGGPVYAWWEWAACASWPVRGADRYEGPWDATTKNPILVLGPRFDPSTPFGNARRVARRLGNAVLLAQDGYGHLSSADPSACVRDQVGRYLVDLLTPPRGTVCPSDRLPFDPDFGEPLSE